jgi:hypothetical protein
MRSGKRRKKMGGKETRWREGRLRMEEDENWKRMKDWRRWLKRKKWRKERLNYDIDWKERRSGGRW